VQLHQLKRHWFGLVVLNLLLNMAVFSALNAFWQPAYALRWFSWQALTSLLVVGRVAGLRTTTAQARLLLPAWGGGTSTQLRGLAHLAGGFLSTSTTGLAGMARGCCTSAGSPGGPVRRLQQRAICSPGWEKTDLLLDGLGAAGCGVDRAVRAVPPDLLAGTRLFWLGSGCELGWTSGVRPASGATSPWLARR
jgi:hypothetical protein